jgi:pimeloyl-ACP methyl ester carboxylesterase
MSPNLKNWLEKGAYFNNKSHKIFYLDEGKGSCLLIVHGYPYNGYDFKKLLPKLASRFRVIIPDMLGMGFSDKPTKYPYSFINHVKIYKDLLRYLNIKEIHILSHDLGNSVVQEMLSQYEEGDTSLNIKSIAFLNGGLFSDVYRPRILQILLSKSPPLIGKMLSRLISKKSIEKATCSVFGKKTQPSQQLLNDFWEILNYHNGKLLAWKIGRLVFEKDVHQHRWISAMQQTKIPMCFINGPADPNSGFNMANRYKELIPSPLIYLLNDDIGHWPQIEDSENVLKYYYEFLKNNHF